jgi:hypothetical protein
MPSSVRREFDASIKVIAQAIAGRTVDNSLEDCLNTTFPAGSTFLDGIETLCGQAISEGWMCKEGRDGLRWGRVCDPSPETQGFSVDVVAMAHAFGPHHSHPMGEIVLTMPRTPAARFDSKGAGWLVYPPGSGHYPTVTGGLAWVLYLLPQGKIAFTK